MGKRTRPQSRVDHEFSNSPQMLSKRLRKVSLAPKAKKRPQRTKTNGLRTIVRTPGTIIKTLNARQPVPTGQSHYVVCRSNPFHGHGGAAIPDGKNSNFVVSDTFSVNNFAPSAAGQTIVIQTLNTLPALAMMGSLSNFTVDGNLVTGLTSLQPSITTSTSYYPVCISPPMINNGLLGSKFSDPYASTTSRMISCGYRLIYTGPATTCAGSITVTPNPIAWGTTATSATGGFSLVPPLITGTAGTTMSLGAVCLNCDIVINDTAMTRATKTFRPEQGVYIVPTHRSNTFELVPTLVQPYAPVANVNTALGAVSNGTMLRPASNGAGNPGVVWFDNDWTTYTIVISGVNADASFRLESVCCMEYCPAITSPFYPMTNNKSPDKPGDMKAGDNANKNNDVKASS